MSIGNLPNDFCVKSFDTSSMENLTKEFILKVIDDGISRHNGSITDYEKAAGLNRQAVKDIRRSKKCPPADVWQKIAREAALNNGFAPAVDNNQLNRIIRDVNSITNILIDRMARMEKKIDFVYYEKKKSDKV